MVEFPLEGGGNVIVEVPGAPRPAGDVTRGLRPGSLTVEAGGTFEDAFSPVQPVAAATVAKLRQRADAPDQIEVEFGSQFERRGRAIVPKVSDEAAFKVVLRWAGTSR